MSKYAITIGSSHAYVLGLNATLNALDYYGVKDIDVYVFSNKFLKDYFDYVKDKFNFPIYYLDVEELCSPYETTFADDGGMAWKECMFVWGKYPLFYQIKDKYEAIGHLDGDMMVVDDISDSFKVAAETGNLLIAGNDRSVYSVADITQPPWNSSRDKMLEFCMVHEVLNYVFFFDAKKYVNLIDYVWAYRNNIEKNSKHYGLETAYFVQGIYECGLIDKMVLLPFSHWISDDYLCKKKIPLVKDKNDKYHLIAPDGNNIKVTHSRFWNPLDSNNAIKLTSPYQQEVLRFNIESHTKLTDFLNYDWKVKLDIVRDLNSSCSEVFPKDRAWTFITK